MCLLSPQRFEKKSKKYFSFDFITVTFLQTESYIKFYYIVKESSNYFFPISAPLYEPLVYSAPTSFPIPL